MIKIIFIFVLIFIIFSIINKYFINKYQKEHYLTYFLPYYQPNLTELSNFYKNNDNNKNYVKKNFDYDIIRIGTLNYEIDFSKILLDYYISKSDTLKAENIVYTDKIKPIQDLLDSKIDFCLTNITALLYYSKFNDNVFKTTRLITKLYKEYLYFFTKKVHRVFTLDDIPSYFIIGMLKDSFSIYLYEELFHFLDYKINIDYKVKIYDSMDDMFDDFVNNKIHMLFLMMTFPNNIISDFLDNNIADDIIYLPFDIKNEQLFFKRLPFLKIDYIDLNNLSPAYLPKRFGKNNYFTYKPDFKCCYCSNIFITRSDVDGHTYEFIKFLFENYKQINNALPNKSYQITQINIDNNGINMLEYHSQVIKYYYEKGLITNQNNYDCRYLVGQKACDKESLENNIFPPTVG